MRDSTLQHWDIKNGFRPGVDTQALLGRVFAPWRDEIPFHQLGNPALFWVLHYHRQPLAGCDVVIVLGYKLGLRREVEPWAQVLSFIERIPAAHTTHFTLKGQIYARNHQRRSERGDVLQCRKTGGPALAH